MHLDIYGSLQPWKTWEQLSRETYLNYNFASQQIKQKNNGISLKFKFHWNLFSGQTAYTDDF